MKTLIAAAALLAAPVLAQAPAAPPAPDAPAAPAPVPAEIDPQRLALGRAAARALLPEGSYARMMQSMMPGMADTLMGQMFETKMGNMMPEGSAPDREIERELGDKTLRQVIAEGDPHFEERMRITNRVTMEAMVPIIARLEPDIREGLARAYARRFTAEQLGAMNAFFATPAGGAFAAESLAIWVDPEIMALMGGLAPELMKEMPAIVEKIHAATAHLPPPPEPKTKGRKSRSKR
jgi:hypothetical protein